MIGFLSSKNKKKFSAFTVLFKRGLEYSRHVNRLYSVFVHDFVLASAAFFLSFQFVADVREFETAQLMQNYLVFSFAATGVFLLTGLYRWMWRFISRRDTVMVIFTSTILAVAYSILSYMMQQKVPVPGGFGIVLWFALVTCLLLPRFLFSFAKSSFEDYQENPVVAVKTPVLILGTGEKAARFIREHCSGRSSPYHAIGLISYHPDHIGRKVHGVTIQGMPTNIENILLAQKKEGVLAQKVLIVEDNFSESDLNHLVEVLLKFELSLHVFSWHPGKLTKIVASKES